MTNRERNLYGPKPGEISNLSVRAFHMIRPRRDAKTQRRMERLARRCARYASGTLTRGAWRQQASAHAKTARRCEIRGAY